MSFVMSACYGVETGREGRSFPMLGGVCFEGAIGCVLSLIIVNFCHLSEVSRLIWRFIMKVCNLQWEAGMDCMDMPMLLCNNFRCGRRFNYEEICG